MEITTKLKNRLSKNIWFHGTKLSSWINIKENGVLADYNKETASDLDFGYGFYLSPTAQKAEQFITRELQIGVFDKQDIPVILEFSFCPLQCQEETECNMLILNDYNEDFANFVFNNRTENFNGTKQHDYDMVYGVMSDSYPTKEIGEYKAGLKSKEDVLLALQKRTSVKQLSLHTQNICDILSLTRVYQLDFDNDVRKELDINE